MKHKDQRKKFETCILMVSKIENFLKTILFSITISSSKLYVINLKLDIISEFSFFLEKKRGFHLKVIQIALVDKGL